MFHNFDTDGDGVITLHEIHEGLKKVFGDVKGSMVIFEEIIRSLDLNGNGAIDYTEFLTAASNKESLLCEINLRLAFNMFDKDKSGTISKSELRDLFETGEKKDD